MGDTIKAELKARTREEYVALARLLADNQEDFMHNLVKARENAGLTQKDLADLLGVSQATVSQFEHYDNDPKLSTVRRYALAVGARLDWQLAEYSEWRTDLVLSSILDRVVPLDRVAGKKQRPVAMPRSAHVVHELEPAA